MDVSKSSVTKLLCIYMNVKWLAVLIPIHHANVEPK